VFTRGLKTQHNIVLTTRRVVIGHMASKNWCTSSIPN